MESAVPEDGEDLDLFGLRLTELAKLAFPKDAKECAAQLRNAYLKAIPPSIVSKILDVERAQKASTGGKKRHLQFSAISMMAKDIQEQVYKSKSILWTSGAKPEGECPNCWQNGAKREQTSRNGSGKSSPTDKNEYGRIVCSYCKHPGHHLSSCWKALKKCLICGGNHSMQRCDRYNPDKSKLSPKNLNE